MTRAAFLKVLDKFGATLDTENEGWDLNVDAPKGKVFTSNGCHCICVPFCNNGGQSWKPEAYADAAAQVECGLDDCDDPDCDVCNDEEE